MRVLDLFAGFGWSEGLRPLGLHDIGLELNADACATRSAAGHATIRADVAQYPPERFRGFDGLIASPPCQDFSVAGKRAGRTGDKGRLIDLVPEWVEAIRPEWIACEQVPPCLGIWQEHAHRYRELGYSTAVAILNSADYGVPQTRKRAYLLASRVRPALLPEPTHGRDPVDSMFGTLRPWVTMAEALGWGLPLEPSPVVMTARNRQTGCDVLRGSSWRAEWFKRQQAEGNWILRGNHSIAGGPLARRPADEPALTVGSRADLWAWELNPGRTPTQPNRRSYGPDEPAPTIAFGHDAASWAWERPATTVCGDPRLGFPGHHDENARSMDPENGSVKLTITEALILQGFRPNLPLQGSRTSQFLQVGNAVCPPMSTAIVGQLAGIEQEAAA